METRASYTLVGAFVLGLMTVLIGAAVWLAGFQFNERPTRYLIFFEGDVTGLGVGSPVRYHGVPVGTVRDIRLDSENVERVRVQVDVARETPIKTNTVAELGLQGITGVAFIQLTGGTRDAPVLVARSKDAMPVIQSRRSLLQEVVTRVPELLQKSVLIADRLARLVDEKNIASISATLDNLRRTSELMGAEEGELRTFLRESRRTVESVRGALGDLQKLVRTMNEKAGPLADSADVALADAKKTLADIRAAAAGVRQVANTLQTMASGSEGPMLEFARSGLYELTLFLGEARVLVDALTRLTSRIERDPAQFFFGDSQRGVEAK